MTRWRAWCTAVVGVTTLACGGLPNASEEAPEPEPAPVAEAPEPEVAPEPAPAATPESLFAPLDPAEPPPGGTPSCPAGASIIRHPRGGALEVYCASSAGQRIGPYLLVQGGRVVESATYVEGVRSGVSVRWSSKTPQPRIGLVHYAADQLDGEAAEWDPEGHLLVRGVWSAGKKTGKFLASTAVEGAEPTFGGACFGAEGAEVWTTTDPAEFVTRACP